ncbi:MAG TPA: PQQ-binding-like beta-propeller repeat protein [Bryobacteraceae bacterium]|nr:PQQ-binding-like beta-propeller repeat protein [Bryobacteraceae bacterium]
MPSRLRSPAALWISALLFPPLGLFVLWTRTAGIARKLLGTLAVLAIAMIHLKYIYGLRIELSGNGMTPIFTFRSPEKHFAELEKSRAVQPDRAPAVAAVEAAPEPPKPAAAASAKLEIANGWTDFRGPLRDGVYRQGEILVDWPARGLELKWKQPVGGGYASFVVAGGRAYTIEQRRDMEFVAAYDLRNGKEVWTHSYPAHFQESMGGDGPRATPVYHGGFIYSMGATGEMRVLDAATGAVKWGKNILRDNQAQNITWGMSASPLIVDDTVVVQPGGSKGNSIAAYDKRTGKHVWKSLDDAQAYTSPMLVTLAGKRQILTATAKRFVGLDASKGTLLWEFPWVTEYNVNSSQPILVDANRFFISAGYGHGAALVEISGSGNSFRAKEIWQNNRMKNRFNSSVLYDGHIYGLDENILACMRVSDGNLMWKGGRYGYGQLLLASGHVVVLSESGELALVKASPEKHIEVSKFQAIEGKTWNVPAIDSGLLLVRNANEMACFQIGRRAGP